MGKVRQPRLTKPAATRSALRKNAATTDDGMPRKPSEPRYPNRAWFKRQLGGMDQKDLAKKIGKDPTHFSRLLSGERPISVNDVVKMANEKGWAVDEIIREFGYPELLHTTLPIKGKITADAKVWPVSSRKSEASSVQVSGYPKDSVAYVADMAGGSLAPYHGATFVLPGSADEKLPPSAFGRLVMVEVDDHLTPLLGVIGKGPQRHTLNLTLFGSDKVLTIKQVHYTAVVLAIVFA